MSNHLQMVVVVCTLIFNDKRNCSKFLCRQKHTISMLLLIFHSVHMLLKRDTLIYRKGNSKNIISPVVEYFVNPNKNLFVGKFLG